MRKKLVSVPFAPYGGVYADSETVKNALIEKAKRIISELDMGDKVNNNVIPRDRKKAERLSERVGDGYGN